MSEIVNITAEQEVTVVVGGTGAGPSGPEVDPTVPADVKDITPQDIAAWNAKAEASALVAETAARTAADSAISARIGALELDGIVNESNDFTLGATHLRKLVTCTTASQITVTIVNDLVYEFAIGSRIALSSMGEGLVKFEPEAGVTIHSRKEYMGIDGKHGFVWLRKIMANEWILEGDLTQAIEEEVYIYNNVVGLPEDEVLAIDLFMKRLKGLNAFEENILSLFDCIMVYPPSGTALTNKYNLLNPIDTDAAHREEYTGSPTHNANGITTNGTTQYTNTNYKQNQAPQNDKHHSIYLRSVGTGCNLGAVDGSFKGDWLGINISSTLYWGVSKAFRSLASPATKTGLWLLNRTSSTYAEVVRNSTLIDSDTGATDTALNLELHTSARNSNGTINVHSADNFCFKSHGRGLSANAKSILLSAIAELQTTWGRNV